MDKKEMLKSLELQLSHLRNTHFTGSGGKLESTNTQNDLIRTILMLEQAIAAEEPAKSPDVEALDALDMSRLRAGQLRPLNAENIDLFEEIAALRRTRQIVMRPRFVVRKVDEVHVWIRDTLLNQLDVGGDRGYSLEEATERANKQNSAFWSTNVVAPIDATYPENWKIQSSGEDRHVAYTFQN